MIQASGLASGVDTRSLVAQLVRVERLPLNRMASQKNDFSRQISRLGDFSSSLSAFGDLIEDFKSASTLLSTQATSQNEESATVSATGSASTGSWEVQIDQLAVAERHRSSSFSSDQAEVQAGTLSIEVWGEDAVEVTLDEGMTLSEARDRIKESGAEVNVSILNSDAGATLSITSKKAGHDPSGSGAGLTLTESSQGLPPLAAGQPLGLSSERAAQNAVARVDGQTVTSTSNRFEGVVEGVTIEARGVSAEAFTISVEPDSSQVSARAETLVNAYNELYRKAGALESEDRRFGRNAKQALRAAFTEASSSSPGGLPNLASVGITTSKDTGELVFDSARFESVLSERPDDLVNLFADPTQGASGRVEALVERYTDGVDGLIQNSRKIWRQRIDTTDRNIERGEARVLAFEERLKRQFTAMEQLISSLNDTSNRFASMLPPPLVSSSGGL